MDATACCKYKTKSVASVQRYRLHVFATRLFLNQSVPFTKVFKEFKQNGTKLSAKLLETLKCTLTLSTVSSFSLGVQNRCPESYLQQITEDRNVLQCMKFGPTEQ